MTVGSRLINAGVRGDGDRIAGLFGQGAIMRTMVLISVAAVLSGCGAVDVGPEVAAFSGALTEATGPMEARLKPRAEAEEQAARQAAIASGTELYIVPDACNQFARAQSTDIAGCELVALEGAPTENGTAKQSLIYVQTLRSYAAALNALASSDAPQQVQTELAGFLGATQELAATFPAFNSFSGKVAATSGPLGNLAGQLAEAQRMRILRKLVQHANQPVSDIVDSLAAYFDADGGVIDAYDALEMASAAMEEARRSGDRAAFGAAVSAFEAEFASFRQAAPQSDLGRILLVKQAQTTLLAHINQPGDLESLLKFVESLKSLSDALQ